MSAAASPTTTPNVTGPVSTVLSTHQLHLPKDFPRPQGNRIKLGPNDWILPPQATLPQLFFYERPSDIPEAEFMPADKMETALERLLLVYPILAGKLVPAERGTFEVEGYENGITFESARTDIKLSDLPLSVEKYTSPSVLPVSLKLVCSFNYLEPLNCSLYHVTHTRFACGGVCLGIFAHHLIVDMESYYYLLKDWIQLYQTGGNTVKQPPTLDRTWSIPTQTEIDERLKDHVEKAHCYNSDHQIEDLDPTTVARIFRLTRQQQQKLKDTASKSAGSWVSTFEAITAFIFRQQFIARHGGTIESAIEAGKKLKADGISLKLAMATNWRKRLQSPPAPVKYFGNAGIYTSVQLTEPDLLVQHSLSSNATLVHDALQANDSKKLRSTMAWITAQEIRTSIKPNFTLVRDMAVTQWNRFCMYDTAFDGNAKPVRVGFPFATLVGFGGYVVITGTPNSNESGDGDLDIFIALPSVAMERLLANQEFQEFFLAPPSHS